MYLKSIEVQGFKSFAHKIKFDFHNGITGIVGPNGSGKSNVADAVRWVLGEQRARQLRGVSMQDVIFAGTENRKPLGFAYVAITLDNSDHQLSVDFEEVTIARRVYRSGESEYLINGVACRLKDVNELFYDTGIGKEGYSIIGQGQIDKILSGKPEDRRELFDEAAGIVKFKRRKNETIKKLEEERLNLSRVKDIISELEIQVGPLEKQSEKAKIFLKKKEELKTYDINMFLIEDTRIRQDIKDLEEKIVISKEHLDNVQKEYDKIKKEYDELEEQMEQNDAEITKTRDGLSENSIKREKNEGRVNLLKEQISNIEQILQNTAQRSTVIEKELGEKNAEHDEYTEKCKELENKLKEQESIKEDTENLLEAAKDEIKRIEGLIEKCKNDIIKLLNDKGSTKAKQQHYDTMLEQVNIRRAELDKRFIEYKSNETEFDELLKNYEKEYASTTEELDTIFSKEEEINQAISDIKENIDKEYRNLNKLNNKYHSDKSKLDTLVNITERYDGYGSGTRRVMEKKTESPGIIGVVADIVRVDKKYETAIETALGGNIQNIVTKDENTAKEMVEYLKKNKLGRVTFLPLSDIRPNKGLKNEDVLKEEGIIGLASDIVNVDKKYVPVAKYLLGSIVVAKNIDVGLKIAKEYDYSLKIVTLEGEFLSPGGSITGGSFKSQSNLLGRRREIEELEESVKNIKEESDRINEKIEEYNERKKNLIAEGNKLEEDKKNLYILQNTAKINIDKTKELLEGLVAGFEQLNNENAQIQTQIKEIKEGRELIESEMGVADQKNQELEEAIAQYDKELKVQDQIEREYNLKYAEKNIECSTLEQSLNFERQNMARILAEIDKLNQEFEYLNAEDDKNQGDIKDKQEQISVIVEELDGLVTLDKELSKKLDELVHIKEEMGKQHKNFFERRDEISANVSNLEKEVLRLENQLERQSALSENLTNYIWDEYELTYHLAMPYRNEQLTDIGEIKKCIAALKDDIKGLGNVNVNAIEDYKQVKERYEFLKTQHDDLIESEKILEGIIAELDTGMKEQFTKNFALIQKEFDKAFKELFGGGKGTLELVEEENLLESGIRIIAQPPGKKLQNMMQLSGGEKSLTAISLLFAIQNLKPSPFCLLDEIEAALDDSNVIRFAKYLHKLTKNTQFIIITHRRGTMNASDRLYGITMQEKGVSTLVSVNLIEDELKKEEELNKRS